MFHFIQNLAPYKVCHFLMWMFILLCLCRNTVHPNIGRELPMLHVDTHPHPLLPGKFNSNWLSGGGGLRLQPYSKKAGQGCLKRGAQVQIVFYKSPLQGICVYPRPLICCWGSLGKREKREQEVHQRGNVRPKQAFSWTSREVSWGKEGRRSSG